MLSLVPLLLLTTRPAVASFNLNTVVKDYWYYVSNHLADTTSEACLAAYGATIECDQTLLGMVSSGSPNFNPDVPAVESMCSTTCKNSLDTYVENVKKACTASGDGALLSSTAKPRPQVSVDMVGEVFRYQYAWSCSKNSTGWCYFNWGYGRDPYYARSDFPCTSGCSIKFMEAAHDYPGSHYSFRIYELEEESSWWENVYEQGWKTVQKCRANGDSDTNTDTAVSQSKTTSSSSKSKTSTKSSASSDEESSPTQTVTIQNTVTQQVTVAPTSTSSSGTSGSGKIRPVGSRLLTLGLPLSIYTIVNVFWL